MSIALLVLNFNGRDLLADCLPSVLRAAEASRHEAECWVIDNGSTDGSLKLLAERFPTVRVARCENRGLCSFNEVLPRLTQPIALLLNNDIRLAAACVDPLVAPLLPGGDRHCFFTAPQCWTFDGQTYEGFRTAVRWRMGLVQASGRLPHYERTIDQPGETAAAGAALAVRRDVFLELGGFDPMYLPGRIEDLDLCYRAFAAGYHGRYVPEARAWHAGAASFGRAFGSRGCDQLALRNTLLFQWKHLHSPRHRIRQAAGIALRMLRDVARAPLQAPDERFATVRAWRAAASRWKETNPDRQCQTARADEFFHRFKVARHSVP